MVLINNKTACHNVCLVCMCARLCFNTLMLGYISAVYRAGYFQSHKRVCLSIYLSIYLSKLCRLAVSNYTITFPAGNTWQTDNCGRKAGFICERPIASTDSVTPAPTPVVPGYCPAGYYSTSASKWQRTPNCMKQNKMRRRPF